ncbi:glycosyltransferase family 39 protein [Streptomyces phaeochromogenes]|uniref:Glycosyltransferase family 39 protein n=1 Tax=Streptomyces phaeochromogenes TaxID=1923 RepID=A0ABZ1HGV6_STRPH|nr:glycosyltransferase family 39 protein [Streptomyces phaeochromogenes]MCX5605815.1 glycosyltransferase family 39 protein [Streptomyces phaeochromogenes]WSD17420.1 glycosyltransferase family 39 protein [Streptomyces phaeochromogenes]
MVVKRPQVAVAVLVPVLVMFGIGLWGIDRGGMWRDEAVTFQVARRSLPQIWQLLHSVDAVHGLYYLLMHPVLALHPGEVALRLPSLCAAAATAGLVAALGARLARPRVGLWAGLLYAVTPMAGHFAQEGRSYALVAAGVAASTLLLARAVTADAGGDGTGGGDEDQEDVPVGRLARHARVVGWCAYGGVVAVTVLLHEFAVLILLAHAATLALARMPRRVWRDWACAAGAVLLVLLPLALVSSGQAEQVAWLRPPGGGTVERLLRSFTGPTQLVLGPYLLLIALALRHPFTPPARRGELSVPTVALPLLLLPPAALIAVSRHWPLYDDRYVLYALAGAPLLAAAGAERLVLAARRVGLARREADDLMRGGLGGAPDPASDAGPGPGLGSDSDRGPGSGLVRGVRVPYAATLAGVLAITLAFVSQLPVLREDRDPARRPDNLAVVSAAAAQRMDPGDPVLFLPSLGRRSALAYPKGFHGTRDIALEEPAPVSGTLYGRETGPDELRRRLAGLDRVWVVAEPYALKPAWYPSDPTERVKLAVVGEEFVPRAEFVRKGSILRLYVRRAPTM